MYHRELNFNYPQLRYCKGHWMADQIATDYYPGWVSKKQRKARILGLPLVKTEDSSDSSDDSSDNSDSDDGTTIPRKRAPTKQLASRGTKKKCTSAEQPPPTEGLPEQIPASGPRLLENLAFNDPLAGLDYEPAISENNVNIPELPQSTSGIAARTPHIPSAASLPPAYPATNTDADHNGISGSPTIRNELAIADAVSGSPPASTSANSLPLHTIQPPAVPGATAGIAHSISGHTPVDKNIDQVPQQPQLEENSKPAPATRSNSKGTKTAKKGGKKSPVLRISHLNHAKNLCARNWKVTYPQGTHEEYNKYWENLAEDVRQNYITLEKSMAVDRQTTAATT
ncbi:hypothetical protein BV25DRAFT_1843400 [Artomyces pyxidatus]|uniref:Uncharacterized protein n=1 Tax=Artomyces pyxidatus TaxID=48021 RepID=A0ACB8SEZ4_9AGAM|nr:hypothetical protein BV25DRAFT_1843400 [Artomyces pyxidatus]